MKIMETPTHAHWRDALARSHKETVIAKIGEGRMILHKGKVLSSSGPASESPILRFVKGKDQNDKLRSNGVSGEDRLGRCFHTRLTDARAMSEDERDDVGREGHYLDDRSRY